MSNLKDAFRKQLMAEDKVPGVAQTDSVKKSAKKQNDDAIKYSQKRMKDYEKPLKPEDATIKYPMTDKEKKEVHNTQELRGGLEDLEYMNEPNDTFKERQKKAIEGDSTMGNGQGKNEEYGNTEPAWGASDADMGKNLVKNTIKRKEAKDANTPDLISMGDDIEVSNKKTPKKKIAVESESTNINEGFSEKGVMIIGKWIDELGAREAAVKVIDSLIKRETGLTSSDFPDTMTFANGLDKLESQLSGKKYDAAFKTAKATVKKMFKENGGLYESNNNNTNNNNTMKPVRRTFKKSFSEMGNPLTLIPESFKVDNYEFELSDGNETYRMRWEGNINEGEAVILRAQNKTQINEDMKKIKHLMGYSSRDAQGALRGSERVDENVEFTNVWNTTVKLLDESQENQGGVIAEEAKTVGNDMARLFETVAGVKLND